MPIISFGGQEIECESGALLRTVLHQHDLSPHNGQSRWLNCKGFGTCGTCAVVVEGEVSSLTKVERWRLQFPPHQPHPNLRLACQCKVLGDVQLRKGEGFWGQRLG